MPADTTNYSSVSATVYINILPVPLTITADNKTVQYSDPVPLFTVQYSGFVNGENWNILTGAWISDPHFLLSAVSNQWNSAWRRI